MANNTSHLGSERLITGIYLTYYPEDDSTDSIIYDVTKLQLSCSLSTGGNSGINCGVSITGNGHRLDREYKYPWLQYPDTAQDNELSPFIFMASISTGRMAEVLIEYTEGDNTNTQQDIIIQGRITSVGRNVQSFDSRSMSATTITIATAWDSFVSIPPSNLYMALNDGYRALVQESDANLRTGNMLKVATTIATEGSSSGFNVARITAAALDNSGGLQAWSSGKFDTGYETGTLESLIDGVNAPRLKLVDPQETSTSLAKYIINCMLAPNILSTEYKTLFSSILQTFFLTAAPRQTPDGKWTLKILPDNMWDDPVMLSVTSAGEELNLVNSSILMGMQKIDAALTTSDMVDVGIRYAGHKGSKLQSSVIVYGEAVRGELSTIKEIVTDEEMKKAKAVDKNGDAVTPLRGLIIKDLPPWVLYVNDPKSAKDLKNDIEYQKKWAQLLARASFMSKDRINSILTMQIPMSYYKTFIDTLGNCIAVTLTDNPGMEGVDGDAMFFGRVENVALTIEVDNNRFTGMLNVSLNGVHTAKEHNTLRVPSTELFEIPKEED